MGWGLLSRAAPGACSESRGLLGPQPLSLRRLKICSRTWLKLWSLGLREASEPWHGGAQPS